jgi:hypothetical protein
MMKHFDQNTIELYVLGSMKVEDIRSDLERHLKECYTCREIAKELTEFYGAMGDQRPLLAANNGNRDDSLVINPEFRPSIRPKIAFPARVWAGARAYPVASSMLSVCVLGLVLLLLKTNGVFKDTNPDRAKLNESLGGLVVYNKGDEILWQIPQVLTKVIALDESVRRTYHSCIGDLDGDGRNEVVTTLPMANEEVRMKYLRAFDSNRTIKLQVEFSGIDVSFRGQGYDATFAPLFPFILSYSNRKDKEILVAASNGRSPMFVTRLDNHGTKLGRVWHYGVLGSQYLVDLDGDGNKEFILCGASDVDEKRTGPGAVIVVIDPRKIVGETESSATRGFGLTLTDCELYYILIPQTDISIATNSKLTVTTLESDEEDVLRFSAYGATAGDSEQFEFIFSRDLKILEVWSSTQTDLLHANLKKEGKVSSVRDQKYLDDLKRRVKYWNGQKWVSEHVMVNHTNPPAGMK